MGRMESVIYQFSSQYQGRNGISLSYIICPNPIPDPAPNTYFIVDYVAMAVLTVAAFEDNTTEVHTYLVNFSLVITRRNLRYKVKTSIIMDV